eukprot:EG_transcript_65089
MQALWFVRHSRHLVGCKTLRCCNQRGPSVVWPLSLHGVAEPSPPPFPVLPVSLSLTPLSCIPCVCALSPIATAACLAVCEPVLQHVVSLFLSVGHIFRPPFI